MNERIKELIKQSTTIEYGADRGFDRVTFDKEKFAELIIKDTMRVVAKNVSREAYLTAAEAIIAHYGVEE